jgi:DNA-binding transcriptional MerR regulator
MKKPTDNWAEPILSSRDVCRLTGVTARQLQWWDKRGLIRPARQGARRAFGPADAIATLVVGELRRKGLSLQRIRRLMRRLRQELTQHEDDLRHSADWYVLTNGEALYLESSPDGVVERLKRQRKPVWLVSLSDEIARLRAFQSTGPRPLGSARRKPPIEEQPSLFD